MAEDDFMTNGIVNDLRLWANDREYGFTYLIEAADTIERLQAVVDALLERPFRGTSAERRGRMYGSDWDAVHTALDALENYRD